MLALAQDVLRPAVISLIETGLLTYNSGIRVAASSVPVTECGLAPHLPLASHLPPFALAAENLLARVSLRLLFTTWRR